MMKLLILFLALMLLEASVLYPAHNPAIVPGPPFTDSSTVYKMPEEWIARPIKYNEAVADSDLVVTLDQHLYPALLPVIREYGAKHDIKISVNEGTCGVSAGMLSRKEADIGGYCCPPGLTDRLPGLKYHTLGISALALLVNVENSVDNVTLEEARRIFSGDIYRWSEVKTFDREKDADYPVQPISRLHCNLRPGHWRLLIGNTNLFGTNTQDVGSIPDMILSVANNKRAIGYEVLWNIVRYKQTGRIKALSVNGYSPYDSEHIISGNYPLYRVYNLTTWEGEHVSNSHAQKLVEYILKQGEKIEKEHNIVPASLLKKSGWRFRGTELIGEPGDK